VTGFTFTRTSQYPNLALGLMVATVLEAPAVHWLVMSRVSSWAWHAAFWALNIYSIYFIWQDRRALLRSQHEVEGGQLRLRLGRRLRLDLPQGAIVRATVEQPPSSLHAKKRPPKDALWVTPLDTPNLKLELAHPVPVRAPLARTRQTSALRLFVDEPEALVAALQRS
jgi:hypothetical protein